MTILFAESQTRGLNGVSFDTIFTVSTTIAIFALGYVFNRLYDNAKHKRELKDINIFLIAYLRSLIDPIQKQSDAFRRLSSDALSKKHQDFAYGDAVGAKFDVLDSLPQIDVFNSFLLGPRKKRTERIAQFNLMLDALDYAKRQRDTAKAQFADFLASHGKYLQQWNTSLSAILRNEEQFVSHAMRNNVPPDQNPFIKDFNHLVHLWNQQADRESMDHVAQHLLEPLRQLCKRESSDPRVHIVIPFVLDCLQVLRNRNHLLLIFGQYFEYQASGLDLKKDALINVLACLEANQ